LLRNIDAIGAFSFEDLKLDDWRRIDWSSICRGCDGIAMSIEFKSICNALRIETYTLHPDHTREQFLAVVLS